jgi:heptosyltransferase-2
MKHALIIKIGAIGDAVMAMPLARELKKQGFQRISWLAGKDIYPILSFVSELNEVITLDERALFGGSKFKAIREILKTWRHLPRATDIYLLHADKRYRLLIPPWFRAKIHSVHVGSRRHHTFDYTRLAEPDRQDNELVYEPYTLPAKKRSQTIAIFPGGAKNAMRDNPLRRWPLEHYVELTKFLLSKGLKLSILGGSSDSWIEPAFAHLRDRLDWQVGKLKLNETVEFLRECQLAVSHDTGPVHLSSLADCPIITIFGPTHSEWFAPLKFKHLVLERTEKLPCQPCYDGKEFGFCTQNKCISGIPPEAVAQKAMGFLGLN